MVSKLSVLLLRQAARRWRDDGEMLAEWTAELSAMDKGRLRYAASLALSRPHRVAAAAPLRPARALATSFVLLLALPAGYVMAGVYSWASPLPDTVPMLSWLVVTNAAAAVLVGLACARLTAGLTSVVKPPFLPAWVFGVPFLLLLSTRALAGLPLPHLFEVVVWFTAAIACGLVVVRLTQHGHTAVAWVFVGAATPVVFLLSNLYGLEYLYGHIGPFSVERVITTTLFSQAAQPLLYVNLFALAYIRGLAAGLVPVAGRTALQPD
jgi:hypothetical protein